MRVLLTMSLMGILLASGGNRAEAQGRALLVGAWERFAMKDSTGTDIRPLPPAAFTIFSADGSYSQIAIPTGRAKVNKPLAEYTKEELLARFSGAEARRGRYSAMGTTLTRTYTVSLDPNAEGRDPQVQHYRIVGDVLILTSTSPATNKSEVRFRRVKAK